MYEVIRRSGNQTMRERIEAHEIERHGIKSVSRASIALSKKEIDFLPFEHVLYSGHKLVSV